MQVIKPFMDISVKALLLAQRAYFAADLATTEHTKTDEGRAQFKADVTESARKLSIEKFGSENSEFIATRVDLALHDHYTDHVEAHIDACRRTIERICETVAALDRSDYRVVSEFFADNQSTYTLLRGFADTPGTIGSDYNFASHFGRCVVFCRALAEEYAERARKTKT